MVPCFRTDKRAHFGDPAALIGFARHEDPTKLLHQFDGRFMPLDRQEFAGLRSQARRYRPQITRMEQAGPIGTKLGSCSARHYEKWGGAPQSPR